MLLPCCRIDVVVSSIIVYRDWLVLTENVACSMQAGFHLGGGEKLLPNFLSENDKLPPPPPPPRSRPYNPKSKKLPPKIEIKYYNDWKQQDDWNNSELDFASQRD